MHLLQEYNAKLKQLKEAIEQTLGVRYYASSLLLLYEGDPDAEPRINIKVIDFANARWARL